jgi:hypothetical protein
MYIPLSFILVFAFGYHQTIEPSPAPTPAISAPVTQPVTTTSAPTPAAPRLPAVYTALVDDLLAQTLVNSLPLTFFALTLTNNVMCLFSIA